tara:strand:+ start:18416 stop:19531 length:1116 start_codon:yes stop_codon:yes gene_type:complete
MESLHSSSFNFPKPRDEVEEMAEYSAPLEGRRGMLRLDFNENTIGPSPAVIEAINAIPSAHISIYPEYKGLKEAIANNLNCQNSCPKIKPLQVGVFNGVDAAIHAVFHSYGNHGDQLLTTAPTFGYYNPCALMQGMKTIAIPYEKDNFEFPYNKIHTTLLQQNTKILLICNPNNPTGTRVQAKEIIKLAKVSPKTLVVIDELYEAFTGDSVLPFVDFNQIPNLLILRSLSKTAGLAGLRIGFAIGNPEVVNRVSRVTGPYDINIFAVTAACAALKDQAYVDNYVAEVLKAKEWLTSKLNQYDIRHHIDGGNYFLIWPKQPPEKIATKLKRQGILIRPMSGKPLIDKSIRVSIGTISQMKQFLQAFNYVENS